MGLFSRIFGGKHGLMGMNGFQKKLWTGLGTIYQTIICKGEHNDRERISQMAKKFRNLSTSGSRLCGM